MRKLIVLLVTLLNMPIAFAGIIQVDFANMNQGPYTLETFEGVFDTGASYSSVSGVRTLTGDGVNRGLGLGLTTNSAPEIINIDFTNAVSSAGFWFGNDDTCCTSGFNAVLDIFTSNGFLDSISVSANMNDINDQFIGFVSDEMVTSISLSYIDANNQLAGLFHAIDDVMWNRADAKVSEPSILLLFGAGLVGIGFIRRKVRKS